MYEVYEERLAEQLLIHYQFVKFVLASCNTADILLETFPLLVGESWDEVKRKWPAILFKFR
jgi:hypothetical protein